MVGATDHCPLLELAMATETDPTTNIKFGSQGLIIITGKLAWLR